MAYPSKPHAKAERKRASGLPGADVPESRTASRNQDDGQARRELVA
jgi:hypothetical protein